MDPASHSQEQIVANGGWIEVKCRCRPRTQRFRMLALLWFLPSAGALFIIGATYPDWSRAARFLDYVEALRFEHWIAGALLLAHPVFAWLAWHYRRTEPEREVTFREPNPDQDLRKLR
jgi:hypothetical protein